MSGAEPGRGSVLLVVRWRALKKEAFSWSERWLWTRRDALVVVTIVLLLRFLWKVWCIFRFRRNMSLCRRRRNGSRFLLQALSYQPGYTGDN